MEKSFWYTNNSPIYPRLDRDLKTDVLVIGGGLAGAMCAYELTCRGESVAVIDAAKIGSGETGRSSAIVSFAHDLIYDRLIKKHGEKAAAEYLRLNKSGMEKINRIIQDEKIDCDYQSRDMILFSTTKKGAKQIKKEYDAYNSLNQKTELSALNYELPFPVTASLKLDGHACLNPYKFLHGVINAAVKRGAKVFEDSPALYEPEHATDKDGKTGMTLKVNGKEIFAKNIVIATHYPYINLSGLYFVKMHQHRGHNVIFGGGQTEIQNIYESAEDNGFEYRPVSGGILCGGANIRTGKYKHKSSYKIVENNILTNFKGAKIMSRFSAQDCMTFDLLPFAGRHNGFAPDDKDDNSQGGKKGGVYVVSGFNKWGFSTAAACSSLIADAIDGKQSYNLFDTKRAYISAAPLNFIANFGVIAGEFANLLINADAKKLKRIQNGQGAIIRNKGKRVGVYRDGAGILHALSAYCPHMRCGLKWNKDELSWDCPCHGSRFDVDGNLLNNPATNNAEKVKIDANSGKDE